PPGPVAPGRGAGAPGGRTPRTEQRSQTEETIMADGSNENSIIPAACPFCENGRRCRRHRDEGRRRHGVASCAMRVAGVRAIIPPLTTIGADRYFHRRTNARLYR